jgi:ABC-type transport system involved in cytochrome bd biosynthesis fused ATPase/permease subunit
MEFGSFFWNKLDEKQMAARREKARADRKKVRGRIRKVENRLISPDQLLLQNDDRTVSHMMSVFSEGSIATQSVTSVSKMKQRTLVGSLREGADSKIAFQLKDLDLAIPKGQLTMIFGEIGSGKSSLFYALLGEMNQKFDDPAPKLRINGSVGFMSQKPWLMAKSIRENIVLDLPFDQERFDLAVRSSALDDDLKLFAEKENRLLGENGENVSGGQRTRIELARMIYQK